MAGRVGGARAGAKCAAAYLRSRVAMGVKRANEKETFFRNAIESRLSRTATRNAKNSKVKSP